MPKAINPGLLTTGPGKTVPAASEEFVLIGAGMAGGPPNIGLPGHIPGGTTGPAEPGWPNPPAESSGGAAFSDHLTGTFAHQAVTITLDGYPPLIISGNVEGAIDELMSAIPPEPPKLGEWFPHIPSVSGIPDWGFARLVDGPIAHFEPPGSTETGATVYPYYWVAPAPTLDRVFNPLLGSDPLTDPVWNHVAGMIGSGAATIGTRAGGYTDSVTGEVVRTRVSGAAAGPSMFCLSGMIYPADRGVLALLHWPDPNSGVAFLDQALVDRCWAALLLGKGLSSATPGYCSTDPGGLICDGTSGGIFSVGTDADGNYDPFVFPGRATGQYNLNEIHTGVSIIDSTALPAPWTGGVPRVQNSVVPGPGQVRLGTDPAAGVASPVSGYGIPILGATASAYSPPPAVDGAIGERRLHHAVTTAGNFFRYRLPYLDDYTQSTGLKYTPKGVDITFTRESGRFFLVAFPYTADPTYVSGARLINAGNFDTGFSQDYWTWQLARYRAVFYGAIGAVGDQEGTLMLVHFRTEADFERCVRDGVMPWDALNGYDVYGYTAASDPWDYSNTVNTDVGATATDFPAPEYGYSASSYHVERANAFHGDSATLPTPVLANCTWSYSAFGAKPFDYTYISGIAYFIPHDVDGALTGPLCFQLDSLEADFQNAWVDGYRTDDNPLTTMGMVAPAQISSPNPAFISLAHFSRSTNSVQYAATPGFTDSLGFRPLRIEFPFSYAGSNGGGVFSDVNGPQNADNLTVSLAGVILPLGDNATPAFSMDAGPRFFVRRLMSNPIQPLSVTDGSGVKLDLSAAPGEKVLFHSTIFCYDAGPPAASIGSYGNFLTLAGRAWDTLQTTIKDSAEFFLDEVYRYTQDFSALLIPGKENALQGPGLQGWVGGPIKTPVRIGNTAYTVADDASWIPSSFLQTLAHESALPAFELQVMGLPDRNPPVVNWVQVPFPSSGLLGYPKTDFTTGYHPNAAELQGGDVQSDYSALAGVRYYIRCLDAGFSRMATDNVDVSGQPFVVLRVDGLSLEDFAYHAPGPGSQAVANVGIALMVKIPGLTTWMDLGRRDGDGPSKQDDVVDGAGCQVLGQYTFTGVDTETGMVYSQVQVNVGPMATLAQGYSHTVGPETRFEIPVLVKVIMTEDAKGYDLTEKNVSPGVFAGGADPAVWAHRVRGLTGLRVVHPDSIESPTTAELDAWAIYTGPAGPGA